MQIHSENTNSVKKGGRIYSDLKLFGLILLFLIIIFMIVLGAGALIVNAAVPELTKEITSKINDIEEIFDAPKPLPTNNSNKNITPKNENNSSPVQEYNYQPGSYKYESVSLCTTCGSNRCVRYKYSDYEFNINKCFAYNDYLDLKNVIGEYNAALKSGQYLLQNYDEEGCLSMQNPLYKGQKVCYSEIKERRDKILTNLSVLKQEINQIIEEGK